MIVSIGVCLKIIKINTIKKLQWQWYVMICFILFFLLAYIAYLFLSTDYQYISINSLLIVFILFFGSVFVIGVLLISYQLIESLTHVALDNIQSNMKLSENTHSLEEKQKELEQTKELLEKKNKELENTLEEFYTLRIGVQNDIKSGNIDEENKKIKEKIDALRVK